MLTALFSIECDSLPHAGMFVRAKDKTVTEDERGRGFGPLWRLAQLRTAHGRRRQMHNRHQLLAVENHARSMTTPQQDVVGMVVRVVTVVFRRDERVPRRII